MLRKRLAGPRCLASRFFCGADSLGLRLGLGLKAEHGREAQHRAGHRDVGSAERYETQDLDRLQASLGKYRPLR